MGCAFTGELKDQQKQQGCRRNRLETIDCRKLSTKVVDMIVENVHILTNKINQDQVKFCVKCLTDHPLFSGLSQDELHFLCSEMIWVKADKDQYLFLQGQAGHSFFIIEKGDVHVEIDGKKVAELKEGQAFGELALLFRASRAASIKCVGDENRYFVMKPSLYRNILKQLKEAEYSKKKEIVEKIGLFQCLTNKQKYSLANNIKQANFKKGQVIFDAGDLSVGIYIVSNGMVQLSVQGKQPLLISDYQVFGQSALKQNARRSGKAICKEDSKLLVIGKKDIERSLGSTIKNLLYYNIQKWALLRCDQFKDFSPTQLNKIIMGFQCFEAADREKIKLRGLVITLEGGMNNCGEGTIFNVDNWVQRNWIGQTLIKNGKGCIGVLAFQKLTEIIGVIENRKKLIRASQKCIEERDDNLNIVDFEVVKKLGQGQFGQVFLVKNTNTGGGLFAVKCLSKKAIKDEDMEGSVIEEKKILEKAIFPYIVGFVKAFHDKQNIFLLMEYLKGKEMFEVIREMPTLNKPIARYYFGCLLLAIEYLHANNIVYRDIKPENSVIDNHGKAYLIDMGTAKELKNENMFKTWTIIGTPHYMAPEVFQGKGYSFQADYWSLGILLYEFICGRLPFGQNINNDPYKLFKIIQKQKVQFPKYITDEKVKKLINFILIKDPKLRVTKVSFEKIKNHQYFAEFNWSDLLEEKILPPYVPRDFRSGKTELNDSTGQKFLRHLYGNKKYGKVENWDEDLGF